MNNTNAHIRKLYDKHLKALPDLNLGDNIFCQCTRNRKYDREGTIREKHFY